MSETPPVLPDPSERSASRDEGLAPLVALGLGPPAHLTLRRHLALLVAAGAASRSTAAAVAELHDELRFAADPQPPLVAAALTARLVAEVEGWLAAAEATGEAAELRRRLDPPAAAVAVPPPSGDGAPEAGADAAEDELPSEDAPAPLAVPRRRLLAGWRGAGAVALAVAVWTALAVALGAWQAPGLARLAGEVDYHLLGGVRSSSGHGRLDALRTAAVQHPDSAGTWQVYAEAARQAGEWDEAVAALRHLVARAPSDAELLNELAWLLCTAPAPHLRDPVEALALAARAVALNPAAHIVDTLAEAAFQTGDVARAVALEREAVASAPGDAAFYRRQLAKFEAARAR